jgi:hypothetical protein
MVARELSTRRKSDLLLGAIALASVLLHVSVLRSYGWFRDEFYYVACGRHLCVDLRRAGEIRCGYCMPYEDRQTLALGRKVEGSEAVFDAHPDHVLDSILRFRHYRSWNDIRAVRPLTSPALLSRLTPARPGRGGSE